MITLNQFDTNQVSGGFDTTVFLVGAGLSLLSYGPVSAATFSSFYEECSANGIVVNGNLTSVEGVVAEFFGNVTCAVGAATISQGMAIITTSVGISASAILAFFA